MEINAAQDVFLNRLDTKYRAFVGGYGSAKSFTGCLDLLLFAAKHPRVPQGFFAPSYPAIRDIFYEAIDEAGSLLGFETSARTGDKEVDLYRGGRSYGTIICRSMDNPNSIIGFKIARAIIDELDVLPQDKAANAWNKIVARLRYLVDGVENCAGVTTTPEGFKFVYDKFKKEPTASYSMVQCSTLENAHNLPEDYIPTLRETYTSELIEAYIGGEFVNLTSGTVFNCYDREANRSDEVIRENEPLYIGMDFNVMKMACAVYVRRGREWHCVEEIVNGYDTPSVVLTIKDKYPGHVITVYPDATGDSRKSTDASRSDISLLKHAGFDVKAKSRNPYVKDRVLSTNKALGDRLLFINDSACPETSRCLEQLAYDKNGEPDKKADLDHLPDAASYPIAYEMPIKKPIIKRRGYV